MMEFGASLRKAREARGLTARQVADSTHILVQIVEDLEREDFSRIVAPIYGRGFVKLYCEAVGLDSSVYVSEFMALYNGERSVRSSDDDVREEDVAMPPKTATDFMFGGTEGAVRSGIREASRSDGGGTDRPGFEETTIGIAGIWRPAVLAAAALCAVFLIYSGCKALYRATDKGNREEAESGYAEKKGESVGSARERMKIPPLYVD